ncbi:hypothetical protein J7J12_03220 [bacterium]|nr:hypothetical protein [bacterium]
MDRSGTVLIYDVKNKKRVLRLCLPFVANFTPDEKYFFACARDDFFGAYYSIIYSVPGFKKYTILHRKKIIGIMLKSVSQKSVKKHGRNLKMFVRYFMRSISNSSEKICDCPMPL